MDVNAGQKDKREILDSVQSCLKIIQLGQEAADRICELQVGFHHEQHDQEWQHS